VLILEKVSSETELKSRVLSWVSCRPSLNLEATGQRCHFSKEDPFVFAMPNVDDSICKKVEVNTPGSNYFKYYVLGVQITPVPTNPCCITC
jgi:hypothetical protein